MGKEQMRTTALMEFNALEKWEARVRESLEDMHLGLESQNDAPQDDEERREQFNLKRQIVLALVDKVVIGKDRQLKVYSGLM
jgi:hypothetical protein